MNLLLATDGGVSQWVLFGILVLVIVLAPLFMSMRNKKEMAKAQEVMDSLKQGDKILTSAGVIGTIVSINENDGYKTVTIETGDDNHKGYMTLDIQAIYMNLSEPVVAENANETQEQPVEEETQETEVVNETETEEVVEASEEKQEKSKRKSSK